jgi:hypothetical protein
MTTNVIETTESNDVVTSVHTPVPPSALPARLSETDKLTLDLAKERRATALAEAKSAVSKGETADLTYKYVVLQLYLKYHLSEQDALNENGDILYGANKPKE